MKERNKAVPAVYLMLRRGDEILLARRCGTGYYDGWYSLPAGHVESSELPTLALIRECQEEIDTTLKEQELKLVHTMYREAHDSTGDRIDLFFEVENGGEYEPVNTEPEKCDDLSWYNVHSLPSNLIQNVRQAIELTVAGECFSELDRVMLDAHAVEFNESQL